MIPLCGSKGFPSTDLKSLRVNLNACKLLEIHPICYIACFFFFFFLIINYFLETNMEGFCSESRMLLFPDLTHFPKCLCVRERDTTSLNSISTLPV